MPRSSRSESAIRANKVLSWLFVTKNDEVITGQFPNVPLFVAVIAGAVPFVASGEIRLWADRCSHLAFIVWSVMEIGWGVNPFRRILGSIILLCMIFIVYVSLR